MKEGKLRNIAIPIVGRIRDMALIRDLRAMMARMPLKCKESRMLILNVYEAMSAERSVRDALEDCLYFSEGWARKEAARILAAAGDASWSNVVDGSDNDWQRLAKIRAEKHDPIIRWILEKPLPVAGKGILSVAQQRGIAIASMNGGAANER